MNGYVLITPARDEERYIEKTLKAVVEQTVPPLRWIIVSDGSTDRTDEIVSGYLKHPFVELLRIQGDHSRNFGAQVRAINNGYERLKGINYSFIGNLDADISVAPNYYEGILGKFSGNPSLGLAGGCIYEKEGGIFKNRRFNNPESVPHAIQLFRRECFESINGYMVLKYGGPDWCAEVMARMKGWKVATFPEHIVYHHRTTGLAEGMLHAHYRLGFLDYSVGSHPLFEIFKCVRRYRAQPFLLSALVRWVGFMISYLYREERMVPPEFVGFLRREQMRRLRSYL